MTWKELSGDERYRVVQMARKGEVPLRELCKTFGVSRQTLKMAMEKADRAAAETLSPKPRGRKGKSREGTALAAARTEKTALERELERWKKKFEIAMTFVELQRKVLNGETLPGEKEEAGEKKSPERRRKRKSTTLPGPDRMPTGLAGDADGCGPGGKPGKS